ncbi:hypothetical protein BLA15945_02039 [Burkholderia lata]|uniref:Uncharacterized protein n=1 Tax=Burkholderia lata (strain ATCC 17760 / DSM 23089 / LMG 22485 / NCIMB 9086 / R18194 / 383) TaxID=482957 RepID=A0A6P2JK69_BURL3|nr:hypothetical protein BLA15945_02039 [Burkholderia lata]
MRQVITACVASERTLHTASTAARLPGHDSKRCTFTLIRYTGTPGGVAEFATSIVPSCAVRSSDSARRISSAGGDAQRSCSSTSTCAAFFCTTNWFFATCSGTPTDGTSIRNAGLAGAVRSGAAASAGLSV